MRTHPPPFRPARIGAVCLLILAAPVFAQGTMRPPVVPQAIESHLEQRRTLEQLEQREAEAAKKTPPPPDTKALPTKKSSSKKVRKSPKAG